MGIFGNIIGKSLGGVAGGIAGGFVGGKKGRKIGSKLGSDLGGTAGALLTPYKKGGKVPKTGPAMLHKGEFVLPAHVKPTKAQKSAVAKGKRTNGGKSSMCGNGSSVVFA